MLDCKTIGFFLKISKEVGKAWRKSNTREPHTPFSASFQTFRVTAHAYLNTPKSADGQFWSLHKHVCVPKKCILRKDVSSIVRPIIKLIQYILSRNVQLNSWQAFIKPWDGFCGPLEVQTHPLPPPDSDYVMQDVKLQLLNLQWFRVLGASFSRFKGHRFSFECFVFEILGSSFSRFRGLRFRVLGASFSSFGCFVFEI